MEGDPNAWMRMTRGLQAVKAASTHRGVWLVLVVVQDGPDVTDLPQDRITGLWNSFEPRYTAAGACMAQPTCPGKPIFEDYRNPGTRHAESEPGTQLAVQL